MSNSNQLKDGVACRGKFNKAKLQSMGGGLQDVGHADVATGGGDLSL
ncbi:hypothetical protein [Amphibacillus cookii]|nr:hypothetical protein [Amphibacillus cookii]MBM7540780.1 hypothetical protein [Amphibacillus cookii]